MIVGKSNLSIEDVRKHSSSYEELIAYSDSLIPDEWRHLSPIVDNQRYICALLLRKCSAIKWDKKKPIIDRIMSETCIVGNPNVLYDAKTIWSELNESKVREYYERSIRGDVIKPRRKT